MEICRNIRVHMATAWSDQNSAIDVWFGVLVEPVARPSFFTCSNSSAYSSLDELLRPRRGELCGAVDQERIDLADPPERVAAGDERDPPPLAGERALGEQGRPVATVAGSLEDHRGRGGLADRDPGIDPGL